MPSPKRPATLADWRKAQIAQLRGQLNLVDAQRKHYEEQSADLSIVIAALKKAQLVGRATRVVRKAKATATKPIPWQHRPENKAKAAKWRRKMSRIRRGAK